MSEIWPDFHHMTPYAVLHILWDELCAIAPYTKYKELYAPKKNDLISESDFYVIDNLLFNVLGATKKFIKNFDDVKIKDDGTVDFDSAGFIQLSDIEDQINGNIIYSYEEGWKSCNKFNLKWAVQRAAILDLLKQKITAYDFEWNALADTWICWNGGEHVDPPILMDLHSSYTSRTFGAYYYYNYLTSMYIVRRIEATFSSAKKFDITSVIYDPTSFVQPPFTSDLYVVWRNDDDVIFKNLYNDGVKPLTLVHIATGEIDISDQNKRSMTAFKYTEKPDNFFKNYNLPFEDFTKKTVGMFSENLYTIETYQKKYDGQPPGHLAVLGK